MQSVSTIQPLGKILVIDDNEVIQRTVQLALHDRGYQVLVAGEIAEALHIVRTKKPDLILLDLSFPMDTTVFSGGERDGFWALDWMRRFEEVKSIPIIIISADEPEKSEAHALAAGASAYFRKPLDKEKLAAKISSLLAKPQ